MSIGPMSGLLGSVAGAPLAQSKGSEVERGQQESSNQNRQVQSQQRAEMAAGIGAADGEDKAAAERDADGRRLWELPPEAENGSADADASSERHSRDASGHCGNSLDLSG